MRIVDVRTGDGVWLALRRFEPAGPRRGVVLAMHAMLANGAYFDRPRGQGFASALAAQGIETFVLDFRGHGLSETPARGWTLDDYACLDLPAALRAISAECGAPAAEVAWVGHSLGGIVSLIALARGAAPLPRALVLATTCIWRRPPLFRRAVIEALDGTARLFGRAPIRALRVGTDDEVASYTRHLASFVRTGRFRSADGRIDYDAALASLALPVLTVIGGGDPLCRPAEARDLTRRLSAATHQEIVVSRAAGYDLDATHFSLWTSRRARPVWDRIAGFVTSAWA